MNRLTLAIFVSVLLDGGFRVETDEVKSVAEGDSVTLHIDYTGIKYILIQWFSPQKLYIARIDGDDNKVSYGDDKMFRDRVQLDQTGSLTIRNIRIKHSGQYDVEITSSRGTSYQKFKLTVHDSPHVSRKQTEELKTLSLMEGDPITLNTDVYKTHGDELILWRFGSEGSLIAKCDLEDNNISSDDADERFSGRLQLDQTGSLTITNSRITDTGLYQLQITNNRETKYMRFSVTVSAVTDAGLSSGAVAGISVVLLLIAAAVSAGVFYYCNQISELKKQMDEKTVLVMKGDPVPLSTDDAHIQTDDVNVYYGGTLMAEVRRGKIASPGNDEIRERLEFNRQTGSLTITNTESTDSGLYELKISSRSREITYKRLTVTVCGELIPTPVVEGGSVTLNTFTVIVEDAEILWRFHNTDIAKKNKEDESISLYEDALDGIFRGRLKVNKQTGSLTITNIGLSHSGEYVLKITSSRASVHEKFSVTLIGRCRSGSVNESTAQNVLDVPEAVRDGANETDPLLNIKAAVGVNEQLGTSVQQH